MNGAIPQSRLNTTWRPRSVRLGWIALSWGSRAFASHRTPRSQHYHRGREPCRAKRQCSPGSTIQPMPIVAPRPIRPGIFKPIIPRGPPVRSDQSWPKRFFPNQVKSTPSAHLTNIHSQDLIVLNSVPNSDRL